MVAEEASESALYDLFMHELKGMYYTENQLVDILGDMSESTTNDTISQAFNDHQAQTREQASRLEGVFAAVDEEPAQRESPVLDGLVEEREQFESEMDHSELRNLHALSAGLKTERNEITTYESLLMLADRLELGDDVTDALQQNLDEEEATRDDLNALATGSKLQSMLDKLTP